MPKKKIHTFKPTLFDLLLLITVAGATYQIKETYFPPTPTENTTQETTQVAVRFSPQGGITHLIVTAINQAESEIYMHAYSFTSPAIANALVNATQRDVKVCLIVDKDEYKRGKVPYANLFRETIDYFAIDPRSGKAHSKYIVIDGKQVIAGSFNFDTNAEEKNRENIVYIINSTETAQKFRDDWLKNQKAISKYKPRRARKNNREPKRKAIRQIVFLKSSQSQHPEGN